MIFTRLLQLAHKGGYNRKDTLPQTGQRLFSGFMVLTLGFSGTVIQDFSQFFLPEVVEAASGSSEESTQVPLPEPEDICDWKTDQALLRAVQSDSEQKVDNTKNQLGSQPCEFEERSKNELVLVRRIEKEVVSPLVEPVSEEKRHEERARELEKMTAGHPIAEMSASIAKLDPEIAALVIGIAKKESNWGKRSPQKQGEDCFNYWGFKGSGDRGVGMGHACFATREEAVEKIAKRLEKLVEKRGTSEPKALVTTWKCGSSCAGHSKESVNKWVSDVNSYYSKVLALN